MKTVLTADCRQWVGLGKAETSVGWFGLSLGWVGFQKSDPCPTLLPSLLAVISLCIWYSMAWWRNRQGSGLAI